MSRFKACIRQAVQLTKVRILLADDHPGFTELAERFLQPEFEIVGKVADGQSLFDAAMRLQMLVVVPTWTVALIRLSRTSSCAGVVISQIKSWVQSKQSRRFARRTEMWSPG